MQDEIEKILKDNFDKRVYANFIFVAAQLVVLLNRERDVPYREDEIKKALDMFVQDALKREPLFRGPERDHLQSLTESLLLVFRRYETQ